MSRMMLLGFVLMSGVLISYAGDNKDRKIMTEEVTYKVDTLTMNGYIAYDASLRDKRPGVLVVHEWWGNNDYARKRARMLAELGYVALALDMYGEGKVVDTPGDAGKMAGSVMQNLDQAKARFVAALNLLKKNPHTDSSRIGAIGYCFGGGVVLGMARMGVDLKGVVSFHGSLGAGAPAKPGSVKGSILVCNGGADPFVTAEQIDAFKKEMADAKVDYKFVSYPGAVHAFTNPESDANGKKFNIPLAYNKAADTQSWAEMQGFFKKIFAR
jgi:dienelactone hydrolase